MYNLNASKKLSGNGCDQLVQNYFVEKKFENNVYKNVTRPAMGRDTWPFNA